MYIITLSTSPYQINKMHKQRNTNNKMTKLISAKYKIYKKTDKH